ncbi:MarR family winged helix-turn-helix transcriptional regulator [Alsobacter soli]|nr:helix-turn-helix domain-containing protein [Alsobacter soli]
MRTPAAPEPPVERPQYELIELFFFAYRDFVGDPDRTLEQYGFGRAHHRVLHFVERNPGLTIAALLDILRITKQSLNRVLKELLEKGYVEQREGLTDRRQRLLYATPRGRALAVDLACMQTKRIDRALAECGAGTEAAAKRFLAAMIEPADRPVVAQLAQHDDDLESRS